MINNVVLIGRLTKDVELRYTPSQVACAQFTLAVNRNFKNQDGQKGLTLSIVSSGESLPRIYQTGLKKGN